MSAKSNLSVIKISRDKWEETVLLCSDNEISNIIYVISSDYIDAYAQEIKNIGFTGDISSAVPYWKLQELSNELISVRNSLSDKIDISCIKNPLSIIYNDLSNELSNGKFNTIEKFEKSYLNFISSVW